MSSSPNSSWISARIQTIDNTLKDIEDYRTEVIKLENLLLGRPDLRVKHPEIAKEGRDQVSKSFDSITKTETFINKSLSLKFFMSWVERLKSSGLHSKEFEELRQEMVKNNEEVKRQAREIRDIERPEASDESDRLLYALFHPPTAKRAFAEPYDEELCEF